MTLFEKYKHLLNRTTFGLGPKVIRRGLPVSIEDAVDDLLVVPEAKSKVRPERGEPVFDRRTFLSMSEQERKMAVEDDRVKLRAVRSNWIYGMASEEGYALHEKMVLFWHGHMACQCNTSVTASSYLKTLRRHALGNVKSLVLAVSKEPAMLRFLNNQQNRKGHPNENFARELLELFTLGEGNYSERDVKEAARAFTGWGINRQGDFMVRPIFHDHGDKAFLGRSGRLDGTDIIDIIFEQREAAEFIAGKLFRYFVSEVPEVAQIQELAGVLYNNQYEIRPTLHYLFTQPWFYDPRFIGRKIKSPVDYIVQITKLFNLNFAHEEALSFLQRGLGQLLFSPPNVAGWPMGKAWINNATLMLRLNLVNFLIDQRSFDHATATPLKAIEASKPMQRLQVDFDLTPLKDCFANIPYDKLEHEIKRHLLSVDLQEPITTMRERRTRDARELIIRRITSLPEFQLC